MLAWTYVLMLCMSITLVTSSEEDEKVPNGDASDEDGDKPLQKDEGSDGEEANEPKFENADGGGDNAAGGALGGGNDSNENDDETIDVGDGEHPKGYTRGISEARRSNKKKGSADRKEEDSGSGGNEAARSGEKNKFEDAKDSGAAPEAQEDIDAFEPGQKFTAIIDGSAEPHQKVRGRPEAGSGSFEDT